ncbi:GDP-mannose 4,6-dehydratase [Bacteriovoracaceae bacterium]|nr:GDP-mannose 4,6-dehydratase [Bacteriovoracaceae bacterium]
MELNKKTILIAGAAGFVPGHLCEYYLKQGIKVIGLDNFITGTRENIELLNKYPNFKFYEVDISKHLPKELEEEDIHYVFSLASPASPIDFPLIPLEIMRVNSEGTLNLLELTKRKQARFLEASTSEVYGDPEIHPQYETYFGNVNPVGPRSCYDESKRFAEALTWSFNQKYKTETRIVRIFNTYGPRMRPNDGRVIPNFVNQALLGQDITVYGDGSQSRSFCFVSDLIRAIDKVMFCSDSTPFNIGNPDEKTILETAKIIIDHVGSKSKIIHCPLPKDDPKRRCPDLTKLQSQTDYIPEVNFLEGLKQTVDYFHSLLR